MEKPRVSWNRSMPARAMRFLPPALALSILLSVSQVSAQFEGRTYAITDARLVTVSGPVIEAGTIVVRGGLIEALGADVRPPADAVLIDGEGISIPNRKTWRSTGDRGSRRPSSHGRTESSGARRFW